MKKILTILLALLKIFAFSLFSFNLELKMKFNIISLAKSSTEETPYNDM